MSNKNKAVWPNHAKRKNREYRTGKSIDPSAVKRITDYTLDKHRSINNILEMFPDIEMAADTLVASILSPKDLFTTNYSLVNEDKLFPASTIGSLNAALKYELENTYDLARSLYPMLKEALVTHGCYAEVFIPSNNLQGVTEALHNSYENEVTLDKFKYAGCNNGLFNFTIPDAISTDSEPVKKLLSHAKEYIESSDDVSIIASPTVKEAIVNTIGKSVESYTEERTTLEELDKLFSRLDNDLQQESVYTVSDTVTGISGRPIHMKLPPESIVPLYSKHDKTIHLGYFVLLDSDGYPVSHAYETNSDDSYVRLTTLAQGALDQAKKDNAPKTKAPELPNMGTIVHKVLDNYIASTLKSSTITAPVDEEILNHIAVTLFTRALEKKKTKVLFVKTSQLSYIAYDYRNNGTGKPLLERVSHLASMRMMSMLTRLTAMVRNSIPNTEVRVKLDDDDVDPEKTMEDTISIVMSTWQSKLPVWTTSLPDMVEWARGAGLSFKFEHFSLPDMEIEYEKKDAGYDVPDEEIENNFKNQIYRALLIPPEIIENNSGAEFATEIVSNNALFAKRCMMYSDETELHLWNKIKIIIENDTIVAKKLKGILESDLTLLKKRFKNINAEIPIDTIDDSVLVDYLLARYIKGMMPKLPKPELYTTDGIYEAFTHYKEIVEEYIESFVSEEALPELFTDEFNMKVEDFKTAILNTLLRRWMIENNYLPEVAEMFSIDETGTVSNNVLLEFHQYTENVEKGIKEYIKALKKTKKGFNKVASDIDSEDDPNTGGVPTPDTDEIYPA